MDIDELLLTTCASNEQFAVNLWDWRGENSVFRYKNGGPISPHMITVVRNDYILGGNKDMPKLYLWQMNNDYHIKDFNLTLPKLASCLCVCPQNHYLVVGIHTNLYIWQIASGKLLAVQRTNYQQIEVIKFSNCGEYLIVGGQDGIVNVYKFVNLVCLDRSNLPQSEIGQTEAFYTKNDHNLPVTDIYVGSFGRKSRFATCSLDHTVKIYQLSTGKLMMNIVYESSVCSIIFDSACWNLFVGCFDGALHQLKLTESTQAPHYHVTIENSNQNSVFKGHKSKVRCLCLNRSETLLASGDDEGLILIWEIMSRQSLKRVENSSAISYLKFIINHKNIYSENLQIMTAMKHLDIEPNVDSNFGVHVCDGCNIEYSEGDCYREQKKQVEEYKEENSYLRANNQQLYYFIKNLRFK